MFIINNKNLFAALALALAVASFLFVSIRGLNLGIEFAGGSVLEVSYESIPDISVLKERVSQLDISASLQPFGDSGVVVRSEDLTEEKRQELVSSLTVNDAVPTIERFNSVGPSFGRELRTKAIIAMILVMVAIIVFIAYAFRSISSSELARKQGLSSWHFGVSAVIALVHDVIIPTAIATLVGIEVDSLFVVGLLSIVGLSVNDTIVVFDRVRENLVRNTELRIRESFDETLGKSLVQTIARSINTSMTLVLALFAIWAYGPEATQNFAFILGVGTVVGTYSSVFFASPLLLFFRREKN